MQNGCRICRTVWKGFQQWLKEKRKSWPKSNIIVLFAYNTIYSDFTDDGVSILQFDVFHSPGPVEEIQWAEPDSLTRHYMVHFEDSFYENLYVVAFELQLATGEEVFSNWE